MDIKISKELILRWIEKVRIFGKSRYGVLAIISIVIVSMTGGIFVLPMYQKTPAPTTFTGNLAPATPTAEPISASPSASFPSAIVTADPTNTPTPIPVMTATPTIDPTAGWLTYSNTAYGYSIKYPTDWNIQNLSPLEPRVPSYIVFNPRTASASSRSITVTVSNRTYQEQLAIGGTGSPIKIASIIGAQQYLNDSNRNKSVTIVLPRASDLVLLHSKLIYTTIFNQMIQTFRLTN